MRTDQPFYVIFREPPEWLATLAGRPTDPQGYTFQAEEFKSVKVSCDGLLQARSGVCAPLVTEFQFKDGDCPLWRAAQEMLAVQRAVAEASQRPDKRKRLRKLSPVEGVVFIARGITKPTTEPWAQIVPVLVFEDVIADLQAKLPDHPLLHLLAPLLEPDDEKVAASLRDHYAPLRAGVEAGDLSGLLLDVFRDLLQQRLPDIPKLQLDMMLKDLPPLRETRAGQELIAEGRQEGRQEGECQMVIRILSVRLGALPAEALARIQALPIARLEDLGIDLFRFTSVEDLIAWLARERS